MRFKSRLIRGTLIQRYKRFLADVRLENGEIVTAHCTNTGSMMGCKEPGSAVYISRSDNLNRKLLYTWELIKTDGTWVGINTLHPNKLVAGSGRVRRDRGTERLSNRFAAKSKSAPTRGSIFAWKEPNGNCFVEVKNVTLAIERHRGVSRRGQRTRHETFERTHAPQTPRPPRRHRFCYPTRRLQHFPPGRRDRSASTAAGCAKRSKPASKRCLTAPR